MQVEMAPLKLEKVKEKHAVMNVANRKLGIEKFSMLFWNFKISSQGDETFFCSVGEWEVFTKISGILGSQKMHCGIVDDHRDP